MNAFDNSVCCMSQCGQGSTDDILSPTCVSSLLGIRIEAVAAGLWHTVCISADGVVYAFGGNQFGQLGTGSEQAEVTPFQLLSLYSPLLEWVECLSFLGSLFFLSAFPIVLHTFYSCHCENLVHLSLSEALS